jgi:hypothetical protein
LGCLGKYDNFAKIILTNMKKILLFASAALVSSAAMAQTGQFGGSPAVSLTGENATVTRANGAAAKGTGLTDTLYYIYASQSGGTLHNYYADAVTPYDSGHLYGPNAFGFKGWAELYRAGNFDVSGNDDTTIQVLGVMAYFNGARSASSTKNLTISLWKRNTSKVAVTGRTKFYIYGLPVATATASKTVNYSALDLTKTAPYYFSSPVTGVNYDFYAGYTQTYTWTGMNGDTIGCATASPEIQNSASLETGTNDTLVNANIIMQTSAGVWQSSVFDLGLGGAGDMMLFPMIKISCPACGVGVKSFSRNELTFFGNVPNPASNATNIKIGLKSIADVNIMITDMTGKTIKTIEKKALNAGEHMIEVNTSDLAAGTYLYLVRTSNGDGIASQLTVIK